MLRGEVVFGVRSDEQAFGAGALVHVPAGERHWFRFDQPGETVVVTGGHGALAMFKGLAEPQRRSAGPLSTLPEAM